MSTIKRLRQFVDFKGISKYKFYQLTGIANGYLDREGNIGTDKCEQILSVFPELNLAWLVTGEGEMTVDSAKTTTIATGDIIGNGNNLIAGNNNKVNSDVIEPEYIEELKEEIEEEVKAQVEKELSIPIVTGDASVASGVDMQTYIAENEDELEYINPSQKVAHANHAELVTDMSMATTFLPGDYVFLRFLKNKNAITDGKRYYFNSKDRSSMIRKVKIEGDNLRLIAENPAFGDIVMSKDNVIRVAKVVGLLRLTFSDYSADIEAVRQKKDEQILKIIEQQGQLISEMAEFSKRENILMQLLANKK